MAEHLFEGNPLLIVFVAPVVDYDIQQRDLLPDAPPKAAIRLIADQYLDTLALIAATCRLDVNPIDVRTGPKIVLPHIEAATAVNPDLHNVDIFISELFKVAVVNVEIMNPLPDAAATAVTFEVLTKWVGVLGRCI